MLGTPDVVAITITRLKECLSDLTTSMRLAIKTNLIGCDKSFGNQSSSAEARVPAIGTIA